MIKIVDIYKMSTRYALNALKHVFLSYVQKRKNLNLTYRHHFLYTQAHSGYFH